MNSKGNDWRNASREAGRERRFSDPEGDYDSRYGRVEDEPYYYNRGSRSEDYRAGSRNVYSSQENPYQTQGGEYSDYGPGYSTANDFSGQEPSRGRLRGPEPRREDRGYGREDSSRYREMNRRSEYPETYRSAMSGYMSEHVGADRGRRDYNENPNEGNLYGRRYGWNQGHRPVNYQRSGERGYMSEDDYDRGSPLYGRAIRYGRSYGSEGQDEGLHKGKGPRNYRRSDNRIQEDINERLTDDPLVDASDVDVTVQNCEVTLSGTVDDREAKRRAEDIAEYVFGVTHVENRIRVRSAADTTSPPPATPL